MVLRQFPEELLRSPVGYCWGTHPVLLVESCHKGNPPTKVKQIHVFHSYILKRSQICYNTIDHTLRLILRNSFYYKRCSYQTILNVSISRCHNRLRSCAEVLIVAFTLLFISIADDVKRRVKGVYNVVSRSCT